MLISQRERQAAWKRERQALIAAIKQGQTVAQLAAAANTTPANIYAKLRREGVYLSRQPASPLPLDKQAYTI